MWGSQLSTWAMPRGWVPWYPSAPFALHLVQVPSIPFYWVCVCVGVRRPFKPTPKGWFILVWRVISMERMVVTRRVFELLSKFWNFEFFECLLSFCVGMLFVCFRNTCVESIVINVSIYGVLGKFFEFAKIFYERYCIYSDLDYYKWKIVLVFHL